MRCQTAAPRAFEQARRRRLRPRPALGYRCHVESTRSPGRFWPLLAIALAPILLRAPFWIAGIALNPLWVTSGLALPGEPSLVPGLPGFIDNSAGWITQASGSIAAHQWLAGHVPWWDPFSGVGMPLAAEVEGAALFFPFVLLLALPAGYLVLAVVLQWIGGGATFALARRLGLGPLAAATGALLFELGGSFAWDGAPYTLSLAFLPVFLLGLERALAAAAQHSRFGYRTIAVGLAFSLYGGFPETAYLGGLMALAWACFRLASAPAGMRVGFAWRVAAGGAAGLALSTPLLLPFVQLLRDGVVGQREAIDMGAITMPEPGDALYMLPYLLGPIAGYSGQDPSGLLNALWGRACGYLGFPLAIAAVLGAVSRRRHERGLRLLLAGWILACLARSAGTPLLRHVWDVVPAMSQVQFFRYSGPTWMLAASLLAAFAVEDQRAGARLRPAWAIAAACVLAGGTAAACWSGRSMIELLRAAAPGYPTFLWLSIAWGALTCLLSLALLGRGRRPELAAALLLADASVLFMVPLLSGPRRPALDVGSIAFLQQNLGLQRFYTLGPFQPNYAGVFGIASINYLYVPLPRSFPDWTRTHLDPRADPVLFLGGFPPDTPGTPSHTDALLSNLDAFAGIGVRYVVAPPVASLIPGVATSTVAGPATPLVLQGGAPVSVMIPPSLAPPGQLAAIGVNLGTYRGAATGTLTIRACSSACSVGTLDLAAADDGNETPVPLQPPLPVGGGQPIAVTVSRSPGSAVVLWLWRNPGRTVHAQSEFADMAPDLPLHYAGLPTLRAVHRSSAMTIFEIPGAAPYFDAPGCTIAPRDREHVATRCPGPAHLLRRELWYPGWHAAINGAAADVQRDGELFQQIDLPAGAADVRFSYSPPGLMPALALFALGLLALLPWPARAIALLRSR